MIIDLKRGNNRRVVVIILQNLLYASIYEVGGEIIGGKGNLADWSPGNFSLHEKERLIEDGIIKE